MVITGLGLGPRLVILDYQPAKQTYVLRVPRGERDVRELVEKFGLNYSTSASTAGEAVLFTPEPYAAAAFAEYATPDAQGQLKGIMDELEASRATSSDLHIACPPDKELWGFQKANIAYALRRQHTLVGDQPGLGKTPTAICFANEIKARRVLVICPASVRLQWAVRVREWTTMRWPYTVYTILKSSHGTHPTAGWTIVSYDLARVPAIHRGLAEGLYDLVILDEAHYLKTPESKRTRAIFGHSGGTGVPGLAGRSGHIMALTGTPLPNRPKEAFTLARHLCHDSIDWMSQNAYETRFNPCVVKDVQRKDGSWTKFVDERSGRHAELQNRLRANFMTRHLKREVMTQLQLPAYDLIYVEEDAAVKQALLAESLLDIDPENLAGANATVLGHIAVVRRQMGVALAPHVADYVDMLFNGGEEKLVLFAWHIEVLDILQRRLVKHGVLRIDGSTSPGRREAIKTAFIKDPKAKILIGNMQAMGIGTDGLQQVCSHAMIAEPSWCPGDNLQAVDRLDRGGQTCKVQADIFVAPGSIAERILASALRKLRVTNQALDKTI